MGNAMGVAALTGAGLTVAYQLLKSSEPPRHSEHTPYTPRRPGNSYRTSSTSESSPRKVTNIYHSTATTVTRNTVDDVTQYNARVGHSANSLIRNSAGDVTQYKTGHSTHSSSRNSVSEVTQNRAGNSTSPVTRNSAGDVTQYKTGHSTNSASRNSVGEVTQNGADNSTSPVTRSSTGDVTQYKAGHSTNSSSRNSFGEVTTNRAGNSTSPVTRSSAGDVTQYKTGRSNNSASTNSAGDVTKSAGNAVVGSMSIEKENKRNEQNVKLPRRRGRKNAHESLVLYHYTNEKSAEAIHESRYIRESSDDSPYAHFGQGVYFTKLSPSCGKERIARNNWTMGWESRVNSGRVDCAVRITFPKHKVKNRSTRKRDLFLHEGPVDLDEYDGLWDIVTVY